MDKARALRFIETVQALINAEIENAKPPHEDDWSGIGVSIYPITNELLEILTEKE